jgi:hypothetical protein
MSVVRAALGRSSGPSRRLAWLRICSFRARVGGRECQLAQHGRRCLLFQTVAADRRAREMTMCGAAETSSGRPIHFRMHSVVQVVAWSDPCRRTTPVWGLRVVIK